MSILIHIVAWKYKDSAGEDERNEHRSKLLALKNAIPELNELHVGSDVLKLDRSFDTGLVAKFADEDALEVYTNHPDHLEVAGMGKVIADKVISVDFFSDS